MKYKYFVPKEINEEIAQSNFPSEVLDRLKRFRESAEKMNAVSLMANLLVYKAGNGWRYVWFQEIRRDVCVYILRRIYKHDEYEVKLNDRTKEEWKQRHALSSGEERELDDEFSIFFREIRKEFLPEEYRKYEEQRAFDRNSDVIFYEMPLWCDGMKKVSEDYKMAIQEALSDGINKDCKQKGVFIYKTIKNSYTIVYRYGTPNSLNGKSDIYLLQIVRGEEPDWSKLEERKYDCERVEDLQNFSSKCYPDYYTYEYTVWKDIEEDDMANLALSEEEVKILQDVEFPFFVSGLAGSGKSTILYYLYANIYKYVAKVNPEHKLLFLSYNDALIDKARMSVKAILSYHSSNEGFKEYFDDPQNLQHFNNSFVPFRDFLKSVFLDSESILLFNEEKHITYEKFCELYESDYKQAGKRLSPSILWSIIRTFIKGRSLKHFTVADYNSDSIARRDKTIDPKIYEEAYKIWDKWYRKYYEDKGYWDDLDLVRYALTNGDCQNVYHDYGVIFCDEAQDFTKLEIDLILNLSKHSEYKLSANPEDKKIPIAFAGDPNQTINPTGFRWAGTKAIFSKAFEDSLDSYPNLADAELSKNYRSQLGIVKFANTIQSVRYKYFDETSKQRKLQSVREDLKGENRDALEYVGFYSYNKHKNIILENLSNANIITAGNGEEGDFSNFPDIQALENSENVRLNTAIGTKGLEYNAVMLLNFSNDPAYKLFEKILSGEEITDSARFEIAHFFTKLYIAVSRAKAQLFIVDTDESYEHFWKYFVEHKLWEDLIKDFNLDEEKRRLVGHVTDGDIETLPQRLSESYDPEENGRQAFEKAKGDRSVSLMERAKSYFSEAKLPALVDECDAYICLYKFEYEKAGDKFITIGKKDKSKDKLHIAITAYWKGSCWAKLLNQLFELQSALPYDEIRLLVANYMSDKTSCVDFLQALVDNIEKLQDVLSSHLDDRSIWNKILDKFESSIKSIANENITKSLLANLDKLSYFIKWHKNGFAKVRAEKYYLKAEYFSKNLNIDSIDDYKKAILLWEEVGETASKEYFNAKKLCADTNSEKIVWMERLDQKQEIKEQFGDQDHTHYQLTDEAANIIFSILLKSDFEKAASYSYPLDKENKWKRLYEQDKVRFLNYVVLDNFTEEKYYFLFDKSQDVSLFDNRLNLDIFNKIFALNTKDNEDCPHWIYFTSKLKNSQSGERLLKRSTTENRVAILDSLAAIIENSNDHYKMKSSCFLEFLFDRDFNFQRAEKYNSTLFTIFGHKNFFKEDFRFSTKRNEYFTYSDLKVEEYELIKENIRRYVEHYLNRVRKVTEKTAEGVKSMFRAFEVCVSYQGTMPDYHSICKMYGKYLNQEKFAEIKSWIGERILFNQLMDDSILQKASYLKFETAFREKQFSFSNFVDDSSKEDASMLVAVINTCGDEYSLNAVLMTAKLIYKHQLKTANLKSFCRTDDLKLALQDRIDIAIEEILSADGRIDEYAIKLLTYAWEALYDNTFCANHYDQLVNKPRLYKLSILVEYLKKRALLHYSYLSPKVFERKQDDYGIAMSRENLPNRYPKIEEKGKKSSVKTEDNDTKKEETTAVTQTKIKKSTTKTAKKDELDPAKAAQLVMAKNLKEAGVPLNIIVQSAPLLTEEEIIKL